MRKNRIGKTDIEATHLSFGGIKLNSNMPDKAENIVSKALDLGINYIDTARCYGQSEVLIGAVMKERRSECYLSSDIDIPKVFLYERYAKRFWLDDFAKEQYAMMEMKGDECVECGKCEDRCPYELPIIEKMAAAHKLLAGKV